MKKSTLAAAAALLALPVTATAQNAFASGTVTATAKI